MAKRPTAVAGAEGRGRHAHDLPLLLVILVVGLLLRAGYVRELMHTPDFAAPLADAAFHDYWARALATGDWAPPAGNADPQIRTSPYLRPPGYPYFLAAVYRLGGPGSYLTIRIVQMALGLISAVLAYVLGKSLLGRGAGWLAALFLCVHWAFIYYEGELQEPSLLVPLALLIALALRAWAVRPTVWRAAVAGVLLGIFALVRANILLFVPAAALWAGWVLWRRQESRRFLPAALALVLGTVLPIAPVTIRNYVVARDFVLISSNGAISLYIGNNERSDGYTARIPELYELTGENTWSWFIYGKMVRGVEAEVGRSLQPAEVAAHFRDKALRYIRENPLRSLGLAAKRVLLFWGPAEVANNKEVHFERRFSALLRWLPGFPLALSTGLLGLFILWRQPGAQRGQKLGRVPQTAAQLESVVLILLFVLVWFTSFIPFLVAERFRVTVAPFLALFGGYAVWRLGGWAAAREWGRLAGWSVGGAVLLAGAEINWARYEPQLSGWHMGRGDAYAKCGYWEQAIAEYARVIELKPTYLAARETLIGALLQQGRPEEALQECRKLLEYTPEDPNVHHNIGRALLDLNRLAAAAEAFGRALRLQPTLTAAHLSLGTALMRQGKLDQAISEFREALRLAPGRPEAYYNLGLALAAQGAVAEAAAAYRAAVDADPGYAEARVNLGTLLAGQGQLDAAIDEYRQALASNPDCFEALYNLAAALATQGQTDPAIAALKRALEIRPDSAPARQALESLQRRSARPSGE